MVDVDAGELIAYRLDQQGGNDRRIHAAGKGQQNLLVTDLRPEGCDLLLDERLRQGRRGDALHVLGTNVGIVVVIHTLFYSSSLKII